MPTLPIILFWSVIGRLWLVCWSQTVKIFGSGYRNLLNFSTTADSGGFGWGNLSISLVTDALEQQNFTPPTCKQTFMCGVDALPLYVCVLNAGLVISCGVGSSPLFLNRSMNRLFCGWKEIVVKILHSPRWGLVLGSTAAQWGHQHVEMLTDINNMLFSRCFSVSSSWWAPSPSVQ